MQYLIGFAAAAATIWPLTAADELVPVPPRLLLEESLLGSTFDNPGTTPKIVGGEQVPRTGQYPWYSAFYARTNGSFYCGGQLISPNYILTGAWFLKRLTVGCCSTYYLLKCHLDSRLLCHCCSRLILYFSWPNSCSLWTKYWRHCHNRRILPIAEW
jgi:hypothetical protein